MLLLTAGLSVVPAIGSQGAGALGARKAHADATIVSNAVETSGELTRAGRLAESRVLRLAQS